MLYNTHGTVIENSPLASAVVEVEVADAHYADANEALLESN